MVVRIFENLYEDTIPATQGFCMRTFDEQVYGFGPWIEDFLYLSNPTLDTAKFNKKQDCEIEYNNAGQAYESRITYTVGRCASDRTKGETSLEYQTSGQVLRARSTRFPNFYIELRMEVLKRKHQNFYPYLFQIQYKCDPGSHEPTQLPSQMHPSSRPLKLIVKCMKLETPSDEFKRELTWWSTHFKMHMSANLCVRTPQAILGKAVKSRANGKRTNEAAYGPEGKVTRNVRRKTAADVPTLDLCAPRDVEALAPPPSQTTEAVVPVAGSPHPATSQGLSPSAMVVIPPKLDERVVQVAAQVIANVLSSLDVPMGLIPCVKATRTEFARYIPELFQQYDGPLSLQIGVPHQAPQQMNQTDGTVVEAIEQRRASPEVHLPTPSPGPHRANQPASDVYVITF